MDLSSFAEQGYVHLKGALSKKQVQILLVDAKAAFVAQMNMIGIWPRDVENEVEFSRCMFEFFKLDEARFIATGRLCQHLVSMHQLSVSSEIMKIVAEVGLKVPTIATRPTMFFNSRYLAKFQGYWKTPAHQDWRSMQGSLNSVVIWVPLLDINRDLGALEIAPGSYRHGLQNTTEDDFYRAINPSCYTDSAFKPIATELGDCLLFSAFTIHRSGTNVTDRVRWSCHFRYNDMAEKNFIERKFPNPYSYKPQQDLITPNFPAQEHLADLFTKR